MKEIRTNKIQYQIKDFKVILKDFEPIVKKSDIKGRSFLIDGNNFPKKAAYIEVSDGSIFKMRYREAWANWLLCVVLSFIWKQDFTFQEDDNGDGIILNKITKEYFFTEHVSAMTYGKGEEIPQGDERILWAINKKIEKDKNHPGYANGKTLVVFADGAEKWSPCRVGRAIEGKHNFEMVYTVVLISINTEDEYSYLVSQLQSDSSPSYVVKINKDFTDWKITQVH